MPAQLLRSVSLNKKNHYDCSHSYKVFLAFVYCGDSLEEPAPLSRVRQLFADTLKVVQTHYDIVFLPLKYIQLSTSTRLSDYADFDSRPRSRELEASSDTEEATDAGMLYRTV